MEVVSLSRLLLIVKAWRSQESSGMSRKDDCCGASSAELGTLSWSVSLPNFSRGRILEVHLDTSFTFKILHHINFFNNDHHLTSLRYLHFFSNVDITQENNGDLVYPANALICDLLDRSRHTTDLKLNPQTRRKKRRRRVSSLSLRLLEGTPSREPALTVRTESKGL
jgi:hypothetical protein